MKKFTPTHLGPRYALGLIIFFACFSQSKIYSQTIGVTAPSASTVYCAGVTTVNVSYSITGTFSNTPSANVFSAQVSDAQGSFAGSPVTIGTKTATTAGSITCTLPSTLLTSGLYRFRVISSNPVINGSDNGANLTIIGISLNSPTVTQSSFCQSETFTVTFTQPSCNFVNTPATNIYSVELSNAAGSFTNPIVLGTKTGTIPAAITCTIPPGTAAGNGYRIRITANSPSVIGPDNGADLTIMAAVGTPSAFGNGKWNAYCFNARNDYANNYQGFYTETALSFNTTTRWAAGLSPSAANATGGTAYTGCTFGNSIYSVTYKRTNIPCGYYQIDVPSHRTEAAIYINGVSVFQHTVCCDAHTNVWTGIIDPSDSVECRFSSSSANGFLNVTFTKLNQLTMSAPVTVCANTTASLTVTNTGTVPVAYTWAPAASLNSSTATAVVATPSATTIYTVTATDTSGSGCALFTNTVTVTVAPLPATNASLTTNVTCAGLSSTSLTAYGANTYTWAPAASLNTSTGNGVIASPTITTTYTVTGSNNCATSTKTLLVTVKNPPSTPSPTTYGNGTWNVFCYNGITFSTLYGYYTENNLTFDSRNRWSSALSPTAAVTSTAGLGYQGCTLTNANHGTISKRTGFTCGYYSIDIGHDDNVTLLIDGVQQFQHIGSGDVHIGAWTGFLGPASLVDIQQVNSSGSASYITATLTSLPVPYLSPPVTICAGTSATLTAVLIPGTTYSWTPSANLSTTTGTITMASATANTNYTCTITDTLTGCSAGSSTSVTVNSAPTTTISSTSSTINCQAQTYTLTASGANTYSWSPSTGLSATTGYSVVASPTANTIYTVSGYNNCSTLNATTNVVVVPLATTTVFPGNTWNAYCFSSTTFTNYYGYYTENGSGTSGYDFNTATRWASGASPSTTSAVNGQAYQGCTMPTTNWSMSFKRSGFTCNTYSIVASNVDDNIALLINGSQVATRATSTVSAVLWVGVLSASTTVELRLVQTTSGSGLSVSFIPAASNPSLSTWCGATSSSWFTSTNWCGSSVPSAANDVIIYNTGTLFQPLINGSGAACNNLTISPASAATSTSSAIPAASLTVTGAFGLDVYGSWINSGGFTPGSGTVSILGSGSKSITCVGTQTFNALVINNDGNITMSSGTHKINSNLNLRLGVIALAGTLHVLSGAGVSNASDSSHVEGGPVIKFGNQAFIFPVGAGGVYRPVGISAPVSATDNFSARYFHTSPSPPYTSTSKDATIDHISNCEYWQLNRTGGSSIVYVTLSWDTSSCGISNLADLLVARWDAGQVKWKDHSNGSTTGNTIKGTLISSSPVTVFSPFTLASKTSTSNILPIELLDFSAQCIKAGVSIQWSTASERNNDYFITERSDDGVSWLAVNTTNSKGSGSSVQNYSFIDPFFSEETIYYRLIQVDKDQSRHIYKTVASKCELSSNDYRFYPNPASNELNMIFNVSENQLNGILSIADNMGRTCMREHLDVKKGMNAFRIPVKLNPGIYFISYTSDTFKGEVQKLIIE